MVAHTGHGYTERQSKTYPFIDPLKLNLNGKSVFISGASKGIGAALANGYARAGASIIGLGSRSSQEELVKTVKSDAIEAGHPEPKVFAYNMDVTDRASVETAAKQFTADAEGHLDFLINNAGYLSTFAKIIDTDPLDWWMNWEVNIKGIYLTTKYFLPTMLKDAKSDRTIVNVSSGGAHFISPGRSGYQTTKLAVLRFSQFIGAEYGDQGVLAYSVHPGGVQTEMGERFSKDSGAPMIDLPEVCGNTVPFLTSERREWLQGRYISCQWNMEEFLQRKDNIIEKDYLKVRMSIGLPGE